MIITNLVNIDNAYGTDAQSDFTIIRSSETSIVFDLKTSAYPIDPGIVGEAKTLIPADINVVSALLSLQFVATHGGSRPGTTRYIIGNPYIINYTLGSSIESLYSFDSNTTENGSVNLELSLTSLGTTPYAVKNRPTQHPLGSDFGNRLDAYGLPFDSAKYDLMIRLDNNTVIRPIYGNITILGRYAGSSVDYPTI